MHDSGVEGYLLTPKRNSPFEHVHVKLDEGPSETVASCSYRALSISDLEWSCSLCSNLTGHIQARLMSAILTKGFHIRVPLHEGFITGRLFG